MKPAPMVTLELGGKERHLLLDLNAMVEFEDKAGKNVWQMKVGPEISAKELRLLLWASLLHEEPQLTPAEVGKWMHGGSFMDILTQIMQAYQNAMPQKEAAKSDAPLESGAGSNSGLKEGSTSVSVSETSGV